MTPAESIAVDVAQLVDGVEERALWSERRIAHTSDCEATRRLLRDGVPFRGEDGQPFLVDGAPVYAVDPEPGLLRHHACSCPRRIEPRAGTVHDRGLLWQLAAVAAVVGGQSVPGEAVPAGSPWDADGALSPSRGGGFESAPPISDALVLADEIQRGVAELYARTRRAAGLPARGRRTISGRLRELVTLAGDVDDRTAERAARRVQSWTRACRVRLKYETRMIRLAGTMCGECGGDLIVAADASTDVVCVGGTVEGPALEGENWPVIYDGCGQRYPRSTWVDLLDANEGGTMSTMTNTERLEVRCLLLFGDQAELAVPGQDEPARWPAAAIADETGIPESELPGKRFRVDVSEDPQSGRTFGAFELVK